MNKRRKYAAGVFLSIAVLAAGLFLGGDRLILNRAGQAFGTFRETEGQIYVSVSLKHFRQEKIALWFEEAEEKYYLFLPSWAEEGGLSLQAPGDKQIFLDGEAVKSRKKTENLTEGLHVLSVGPKEYPLEVMQGKNLPAMFLSMEEEKRLAIYQIPYTEQYGAGLRLVDHTGNMEMEANVSGIRVRGNTSADWVKKPYQLTMSQPADFFGMGSAIKWNLLSNWSDKTLLRNQIAYDLARDAKIAYSPESAFVDLYINGEYQGVYQLSEKVEIGQNRVAIRNLEDYTLYEEETGSSAVMGSFENGMAYKGYETNLATEDITGGYLLEIERPSRIEESVSYFKTLHGQPVTVKRPKYADVEEVRYIAGLWQEMEDAVFSEDGYHPGTGKHYTEYVDIDSFVKKYLLEEIVRNYDASSTSQYFYKPADEESQAIYAGPAWDYDMSLGNPGMSPLTNQNYISSVSPYGLFAALPMDEFSIWYQLYRHEDFVERVKEIYNNTFRPHLEVLEESGVEACALEIENSAIMDGIRWKRNEGTDDAARRQEYRENVEGLKTFIATREYYLTGLWVDGRESKKVYLDGGQADMYISYVEGLVGDCLEVPLAPVMEGHTFVGWLNGYTKEPYDFSKPYMGEDLYFVAEYVNDKDGSTLIAGE